MNTPSPTATESLPEFATTHAQFKPLMSTLKFETAGSGAGQANDMRLTGIIDADDFRNRILEARDALKQRGACAICGGGPVGN